MPDIFFFNRSEHKQTMGCRNQQHQQCKRQCVLKHMKSCGEAVAQLVECAPHTNSSLELPRFESDLWPFVARQPVSLSSPFLSVFGLTIKIKQWKRLRKYEFVHSLNKVLWRCWRCKNKNKKKKKKKKRWSQVDDSGLTIPHSQLSFGQCSH